MVTRKIDWSQPLELTVSERKRFDVRYKHSDGPDLEYPHVVRVKYVFIDGAHLPAIMYHLSDHGYIRGASGAFVQNRERSLDWIGRIEMTDEYFHGHHNRCRNMDVKPHVTNVTHDLFCGGKDVWLSSGTVVSTTLDGRGVISRLQAFVNV